MALFFVVDVDIFFGCEMKGEQGERFVKCSHRRKKTMQEESILTEHYCLSSKGLKGVNHVNGISHDAVDGFNNTVHLERRLI